MSDAASRPSVHELTRTRTRLAAGFAALLGLTYGLIVLGALVRAHGAGLACPDWPLCFGEVIPAFDVKVAFEVGHRAVAGTVGLCFLGLGAGALARPALRAELGRWLALAAGLLAVQVLLGALTVWELLASWTVTSHLLVGNAFAVSLLFLVLRLRDGAVPQTPSLPGAVRWGSAACAVLLVAQMLLGGLVASKFIGLACPDWPTCSNGEWFPTLEGAVGIHLLHRLAGYGLVAGLLVLALAARGGPLGRPLGVAAGLGVAQIFVGVANVLGRLPVEVTGLHSALAAALVLLLATAVWRCFPSGPPPTRRTPIEAS